MDTKNLQVIRESFGRVVYSHKVHEKSAEIEDSCERKVRWINIILTALTSGSLISSFFAGNSYLPYIAATFSTLTLAFVIFQLSFTPKERAEKHRQAAKGLWYIREKYIHLITDIMTQQLSSETIVHRRDHLLDELRMVYKFAPNTSSKAYEKARKALKIDEEMTFSTEEIDLFLPENLRLEKIN